jgi:hypothetical protein
VQCAAGMAASMARQAPADDVKKAAHEPVGIAAAGLKFDFQRLFFSAAAEIGTSPAIGEQAHPIPGNPRHASFGQDGGETFDGVRAFVHAKPVDLAVSVKGGQGPGPVTLEGWAGGQGGCIPGHERDDRARLGQIGQRSGKWSRIIDIRDNAVAQNGGEPHTAQRAASVGGTGLDQPDPAGHLAWLVTEAGPGPREHRRGRIHDGHLIAIPGQGNRLITGPAPDIDQCDWRLRQMVPKVAADHVGAYTPPHRPVVPIHETLSQRSPHVISRHQPSLPHKYFRRTAPRPAYGR